MPDYYEVTAFGLHRWYIWEVRGSTGEFKSSHFFLWSAKFHAWLLARDVRRRRASEAKKQRRLENAPVFRFHTA